MAEQLQSNLRKLEARGADVSVPAQQPRPQPQQPQQPHALQGPPQHRGDARAPAPVGGQRSWPNYSRVEQPSLAASQQCAHAHAPPSERGTPPPPPAQGCAHAPRATALSAPPPPLSEPGRMVQSLVEQWLDPAQGGAPTLSLVVLKKRLVDIMEKDLAFKAEYKAGKLALTL